MTLPSTRLLLSLGLAVVAGCYPTIPFEGGEAKDGLVGDDGSDGSDGGDGADGGDGTDGGDGGAGDCTGFVDDDGDGFGAGPEVEYICDQPGYVDNALDCDDGDAQIFPEAPERCNEVDDDCDGAIDNDIQTIWYVDADGDGHGDPLSEVETCDPESGVVAEGDDCDDAVGTTFPGADELCNEVDDDCDVDVDEDAIDAPDWFDDADGDTFGDPATLLTQCAAPGDTAVLVGLDCDDLDPAINPDAQEVCNEVDDDCDGDIDDDDTSVDVSTGTVFYADTDTDGFGDADVSVQTCAMPSGFVLDATDCDDSSAAISPAETEVCNGIDDDCDALVDDYDDSVDLTTGSVFYPDSDGDSYGDLSAARDYCLAPLGYVSDATDCDDTDLAVNPAATEVCNGYDDDCDSYVDDDDTSLDTSTWETWYADSDGDGTGDPDTSAQSCDAPSGYVSNDDDCDDDDATDTDGDGTQDCADDDIDGDGLRNGWDADPYDDSIVRGPTAGLGTDGTVSVTGSEVWGTHTTLSASATAGATSLVVLDASSFVVGDELLILDQQGTDAGQYEFVFVAAVSSSTITTEPALTLDWDASDVVLVQKVPHYTTVDVTGTITADDWAGSGGGVVAFRATGAVTISGTIDLDGLGYEGGAGVSGNSNDAYQGESYGGLGSRGNRSANGGGGGSRSEVEDVSACGGGGAHQSDGADGGDLWWNYSYGSYGGGSYGSATLGTLFFGSGGGAGSPDDDGDGSSSQNTTGSGGDGGGILAIFSGTSITSSGTLSVEGLEGDDASWGSRSYGGEIGAGGGGAGGSIWLAAPTVVVSGKLGIDGGDGGTGRSDYSYYSYYQTTPYGGTGSTGRAYVQYTGTFTNGSGVSATTGTYVD